VLSARPAAALALTTDGTMTVTLLRGRSMRSNSTHVVLLGVSIDEHA